MRPLLLKGHERALNRVRLNREGDILFSCSKGKEISVWYVDNGERIGTYEGEQGHKGVIWDVDVSWDTSTLVSASGDSTFKVQLRMYIIFILQIWDVESGFCKHTLNTNTVCRSVSLSYSGNLAAFTTNKLSQQPNLLCVVDIREKCTSIHDCLMNVSLQHQSDSCIFSQLDNMIIIGTNNGQLQQFDIRSPDDAINFNSSHSKNITDLQLSTEQGFILSSSMDKTAQLHNAHTLETSGRPVNSAAISPTRDHIILGGGEEAIHVTQTAASSGQFEAKLYHLVYEEEFARFKGHFGPINSIAFNPTGNIVVSGGEDGYVRIQELDKEYLDFEFDY